MAIDSHAKSMLTHETRALLARLALVKPFSLQELMLPAAALLPAAQVAIDRFLITDRRELRRLLQSYLRWLQQPDNAATPAEAQRRFTILRLKFNIVLVQFDMFADVITQRSESETGVWLSGLDVVAAEALALPGYYESPPVICYLDRDVGAAIRRTRTRMPGGGENPVAIIRVPRERMVGTGIASSLVHEVGHQAAALLDLVESLRPTLRGLQRGAAGAARTVWQLWERWISEIVADFWSVARVGIASTLGLIGVVSLPRAFVFRLNVGDPHPIPWIRVKLSAAIGEALFPHPQWRQLSATWDAFYPTAGLAQETRSLLEALQASMPAFVALLINHRPRALGGRSLMEVMETASRQPARLTALYQQWNSQPSEMYRASPTLVFAAIGQARADRRISAEDESTLFCKLLTFWALRATVNMSEICAEAPRVRAAAA